jgi:uncharacterized protein YceK
MKKRFHLLAIVLLPIACLLVFSGCSSVNATAKDDTAVRDRAGIYLSNWGGPEYR